jgi:hypothetical protein
MCIKTEGQIHFEVHANIFIIPTDGQVNLKDMRLISLNHLFKKKQFEFLSV